MATIVLYTSTQPFVLTRENALVALTSHTLISIQSVL